MRAILTYHSVDDTGSAVSISPEAFRAHVDWLSSGEVPVLPMGELLRSPADADGVAVTFDDGFVNFAERAWPLLRDRGLPATLFVVTGHVGGVNDWGQRPDLDVPELPLLGWDDLGRLAEEGVSVQSHGRSHEPLSRLSDDRLQEEVAGSAEVLADRLGRPPAGFAYPYGEAAGRARAAVADAYEWACTTELRPLADGVDRHALPRLDAAYFRGAAALRRWDRPSFRWHLCIRRGGRSVRRALSGPPWGG